MREQPLYVGITMTLRRRLKRESRLVEEGPFPFPSKCQSIDDTQHSPGISAVARVICTPTGLARDCAGAGVLIDELVSKLIEANSLDFIFSVFILGRGFPSAPRCIDAFDLFIPLLRYGDAGWLSLFSSCFTQHSYSIFSHSAVCKGWSVGGKQDMTSNDVLASSSCVHTAVATFLKHSSYQRSAVFNYDYFFLFFFNIYRWLTD